MVDLYRIGESGDDHQLKEMIQQHFAYTDSLKAAEILEDWENQQHHFIKVYPTEYHQMIQATETLADQGFVGDELVTKAFEAVVGPQLTIPGKERD